MDSCDSAGRKNKTDGFWNVLAQSRTCMDAISSDNRSRGASCFAQILRIFE